MAALDYTKPGKELESSGHHRLVSNCLLKKSAATVIVGGDKIFKNTIEVPFSMLKVTLSVKCLDLGGSRC